MTQPRAWPQIPDGEERFILTQRDLDRYQQYLHTQPPHVAWLAGNYISAHCVAVIVMDDLARVWGNYCAGVKP